MIKPLSIALLSLTLMSTAQAELQPYQYDPAKHTEVMRKHCDELQKKLDMIALRKKRGVNHWEKESIDKKQGELESRQTKECGQFKAN